MCRAWYFERAPGKAVWYAGKVLARIQTKDPLDELSGAEKIDRYYHTYEIECVPLLLAADSLYCLLRTITSCLTHALESPAFVHPGSPTPSIR